MSDEKTKFAKLLQLNKSLSWFTDNAMWIPKNGQIVWLSDNSGSFKKGNGISMLGALPFIGAGTTTWSDITGSPGSNTGLVSYLDTNYLKYTSLLTGLSVVGGTITSTDTILQAFGKLQNQLNAVASPMIYKGVWNANTNSPTLTSSLGTKGDTYRVTVSGSTNLNGITDWKAGDFAVFNGGTWDKWDSTDAVTSINGYVGVVNLIAHDLLMTGYISGAGTISATDTIKEAIQKLNGNITSGITLQSEYIGYGSISNTLTGSSLLRFNGTNLVIGGTTIITGQGVFFVLSEGSDVYFMNSSGNTKMARFSLSESSIVSKVTIGSNDITLPPTAYLHVAPGTTTVPSIKIQSGTLVSVIASSVNNGAIEYDGTNFYGTIGSTREKIVRTNTNFSYDNSYSISGTPSYVLGAGAGVGATASITGNNESGVFTINTGIGGSSSQDVITINLSGGFSYPNKAIMTLSCEDDATALSGHIINLIVSGNTNSVTITTNSFQSLSPSSSYNVNYIISGN